MTVSPYGQDTLFCFCTGWKRAQKKCYRTGPTLDYNYLRNKYRNDLTYSSPDFIPVCECWAKRLSGWEVFFLETWGIKMCWWNWSSGVFDAKCEFPSCTRVQDKPVVLTFQYNFHYILDDVIFFSLVACTQRNETFVILILTPLLYICIVTANFWYFQLWFRSWTLQKISSSSKITI